MERQLNLSCSRDAGRATPRHLLYEPSTISKPRLRGGVLLVAACVLMGCSNPGEAQQPATVDQARERNGSPIEQIDVTPEPAPDAQQAGPIALLNPPKPGDVWWMRQGKGYALCEAMYSALQNYTPDDVRSCPDALALTLPGMRDLPGWIDLDPREHKDLYNSLMQYHRVGARAYFGDAPELFERDKYSPEALERGYQNFLTLPGARMRALTRQFFLYDLGGSPRYETPQTIVEIHRLLPDACPRVAASPEQVWTYYTNPDLAGPDSRIQPYEEAAAKSGRFVEYRGVAHLMRTSGPGIMFYRDFGRGVLQAFCEIQQNPAR